MAKKYKTGKSQREAVKAYRERTPQKNFCVTVSEGQYAEDKKLLNAHGLTTGKFWRWAIEQLKQQPLPNIDESNIATEPLADTPQD